PADKLVETLAAIAHRHKALLERLAVFNPEDPTLKKLIEQARNAVNISDYDRADRLLEKVETAEMEAVRKAEQLAADAQSEANRKRLKVAAVRAARGNISLTKLDYRQAAEHFKEASEIVPASNRLQRNEYLSNYAFALYRQGTERIDGEALQEAILTYREILKDYTRELLPQDWAMTQNNLGNALQEQGLRSGGEAGARLLAKAVTAYCQALEIHTREQLPQDWATTQNNLGNALAELGKLKNDKKLIERAIAAIQSVAGYYQEIGVSRYDAYFGDKLKSLKEMLTE
ncbi:MAG: tetratricopeptide repeat protein, partial [Gammaproteobacteria bacterium]